MIFSLQSSIPVGARTSGTPPAARPVTLLPAYTRDHDLLRKLYAGTRTEEMAQTGWTPEQVNAFLAMQCQAQQQHYRRTFPKALNYLILVDGQPVGRLLVNRTESEIRVVDLSLFPEVRGKGIGTTLLRRLQAEARAAGRPIRLHVRPGNRACRLYQRLGFAITGNTAAHLQMEWQHCRSSIGRRAEPQRDHTLGTPNIERRSPWRNHS